MSVWIIVRIAIAVTSLAALWLVIGAPSEWSSPM
jgi:hypothetical protein